MPIVCPIHCTLIDEKKTIRKQYNGISSEFLTLGTKQGEDSRQSRTRKAICDQGACSICGIGINKKCKYTGKDENGPIG